MRGASLTDPCGANAHQAVLRALYAYFMDMEPADVLRMEIPLHTVIQLSPGPYAFVETRWKLV